MLCSALPYSALLCYATITTTSKEIRLDGFLNRDLWYVICDGRRIWRRIRENKINPVNWFAETETGGGVCDMFTM
ncbi:hypothetical protein GGS21DRAFT_504672 [Xylaria nigripes]|nr:hypothetical protein GGS21DRAFT_504672 [Xylaria nigripes]